MRTTVCFGIQFSRSNVLEYDLVVHVTRRAKVTHNKELVSRATFADLFFNQTDSGFKDRRGYIQDIRRYGKAKISQAEISHVL